MSDGLSIELTAEQLEAIVQAVAERVLGRVDETNGRTPWLTAAEAGDYLRWPVKRIYNLTAADAIPHRKQEGRVLFHRDELDAWLERYREGRR